MENNKGKKTLGRRKIEIKKIEKKSSLQVTFTKRRRGLFRKASELSILCGAEIAILIQSPAQKLFAFAHPTVEAVLDRLTSPAENSRRIALPGGGDDGRSRYEKAVEVLEMEKRMNGFWWEKEIEGFELQELEGFLAGLEELRENVNGKLQVMELLRGGGEFEMAAPPPISGGLVDQQLLKY